MASASKIIDILPRFLMGLLPGLAGGFASSAASRAIGGRYNFTYPELTQDFVYDVDNVKDANTTSIGGKNTVMPAMNGTRMSRENIDAVLAQTLDKHNRAVKEGNEQDLVEWWPGEDVRPRRTIHPQSTAISGIKIRDDGAIQIQWHGGKGKWYTYRGGDDIRETTEKVKDLLLYPSIGRALAHGKERANATYVWPNSKHLNSEGKVDNSLGKAGDPNLSRWRDDNYEEDRSKWGD